MKNTKKIAVISASGGMDSTGLLVHLLSKDYTCHVLSFNYGQKHSLELERLEKNINYLKKDNNILYKNIDLSSLMSMFYSSLTDKSQDTPDGHYSDDTMKKTVVPNRNAIFGSLIYGYALSIAKKNKTNVKIAMGVHSGDHTIYPDCRKEFFDSLYSSFALGNWDSDLVELYLPYLQYDKTYILKDTLKNCKVLDLDFDTILKNTNTCYKPNDLGQSCGKCGSCTERLEAFEIINKKDPVEYIDD